MPAVRLYGPVIGHFEPVHGFGANVGFTFKLDAMRTHGSSSGNRFQSPGGFLTLYDQVQLKPRFRGGLQAGKLLFAPQTHISFFGRHFHILTKRQNAAEQMVINRLQILLAQILLSDELLICKWR